MRGQTVAALGFRAHTGWAAVIAVTKECEVLERRRIAFEPPSTRFVYHKVAEIPLEQAETMIAAARAEATAAVERQIKILIAALAERRIAIRAACVPAGNSKLPNVLADILAAHSRIHAAEGVFYREALVVRGVIPAAHGRCPDVELDDVDRAEVRALLTGMA